MFSLEWIVKNRIHKYMGDEYLNDCLVTYIEKNNFLWYWQWNNHRTFSKYENASRTIICKSLNILDFFCHDIMYYNILLLWKYYVHVEEQHRERAEDSSSKPTPMAPLVLPNHELEMNNRVQLYLYTMLSDVVHVLWFH